MGAWTTLNSFTAVDYGKNLSLNWPGLTKDQSPHLYILDCLPVFSLCASIHPYLSILHALIACFIKMNWNAHAAGFGDIAISLQTQYTVQLEAQVALNTPFK